jgi:hypothetical protein
MRKNSVSEVRIKDTLRMQLNVTPSKSSKRSGFTSNDDSTDFDHIYVHSLKILKAAGKFLKAVCRQYVTVVLETGEK